MIGQPPRSNRGDFDKRELERWFEDIYRYLKTGTSGSTTTTTVNETTIIGGGSSTSIVNNYNSKRYLRWMQI